ncbi:MAG: choice-of-anchor D domain-containing protein [Candidatus Parcubacteria bacterium]|nr:choice-of-anchor D domain-containing protein [Candidatus Parcubacteria bacterium]
MLKINNKIIFPAILLVIVIAVALFFILQFKTIKPNEPQPGGKILTQEEMIKFYQELSDTVPGTKKYINPYTLVENLGNGKFQAEISSVPKINQDGEEINIAWAQKEEGLFEGGNNFFAVSVNGANTMVSAIYDLSEGIKKGDIAKWNPQIFLNEKEVMPISDTPILLKNDPYNKNYHNNVLEWDYGICKRQLRLIEGNILEFYIFALNPNGDIEIKSNISGNLRASAPYAIDAKKNPLESFRIDGDRKILSSSSFDSVDYPVVIDDSYVGSSSLEDGDLMPIGSTNYSSVWNLYTADYVRTYDLSVGQYSTSQGKYRIMRGFVYFDTSAIPSTATISAATLGLMSGSPGPGSFNVVIQSGQPSHPQIPLSGSDFYKGYYSGNGGQIGSSAFNTNFGLYVNIPMSSQGIGWIQKGTGAITKLCLRSSNDISGIFYEEYIYPYTAETGSGYEPKLSVTYTLPNPTISVTPASLNFGNVNNGAYYNMDFTVQNTGGGALLGSVSGLTAPFSCFNGCTYNLTAGASQSTTIKFSPTSVGSFSGTVVFSGAAGASRPVSGNGITPKCIPTGTTNTNYTISTATLGGSTLCEITGDDGVEGGNLT